MQRCVQESAGDIRLTLWRLGGILVWENDFQLEKSAFPDCFFLAWYATVPLLEVHHTVRTAYWLCKETKGMVASPLLPNTYVSNLIVASLKQT